MTLVPSRVVIARGLVIAAFVLLAYLVVSSWPAINRVLMTVQWWVLGLAIGALVMANAGAALVFTGLVKRGRRQALPDAEVAGSFLISQIAKYIPGRVWGVAMQALFLRTDGAVGRIVAANIELTIVTLVVVTGAGTGLLVWQHIGFVPAVVSLLGVWCAGVWMLRLDGTRWIARVCSRMFPGAGRRILGGLADDDAHGLPADGSWLTGGGLLLFLLMYCAGWWLLVVAMTSLDARTSMGIVAALSLSYVVGVASMLPAGIGAREGALVLLAPALGVAHVDMAALAVASRAAMVLMDVVAALGGAVLLRKILTGRGQNG